jgi:murein L,D-transpeptidase YcbB/YkuD
MHTSPCAPLFADAVRARLRAAPLGCIELRNFAQLASGLLRGATMNNAFAAQILYAILH